MVDAQTRIRITIGDLLIQLAHAQQRIEELEEKLEERESKQIAHTDHSAVNGDGRSAVP